MQISSSFKLCNSRKGTKWIKVQVQTLLEPNNVAICFQKYKMPSGISGLIDSSRAARSSHLPAVHGSIPVKSTTNARLAPIEVRLSRLASSAATAASLQGPRISPWKKPTCRCSRLAFILSTCGARTLSTK